MDYKLVTEEELTKMTVIDPADRELIEKTVGGVTDEHPLAEAIRGYLVQEFTENIVDDEFRSELPADAAAFCDGWEAARGYFSKVHVVVPFGQGGKSDYNPQVYTDLARAQEGEETMRRALPESSHAIVLFENVEVE